MYSTSFVLLSIAEQSGSSTATEYIEEVNVAFLLDGLPQT